MKVIFTGTKNFWRLRANVDISIIEYGGLDTYEIVAFNPVMHVEDRAYVSSTAVNDRINKEKLESEISLRREELNRKRKKVSNDELRNEILTSLSADYLVSRANVTIQDDKFVLSLQQCAGDAPVSELVKEKPESLIPMPIGRQKLASSTEVATTLDALRADAKKLSEACDNANNLSKLVTKTSDGFRNMLNYSRHVREDLNHSSVAKQRWIRAIRRVILQNTVAAVQRLIERCNFSAKRSSEQSYAIVDNQDNSTILSSSSLSAPTASLKRLAPLGDSSRQLSGVSSDATVLIDGAGERCAFQSPRIALESPRRLDPIPTAANPVAKESDTINGADSRSNSGAVSLKVTTVKSNGGNAANNLPPRRRATMSERLPSVQENEKLKAAASAVKRATLPDNPSTPPTSSAASGGGSGKSSAAAVGRLPSGGGAAAASRKGSLMPLTSAKSVRA